MTLTREQLDEMVKRFLSWPLPDSVCSDFCVTVRDYKPPNRVGTNLLTADEARQMLEHVLKSPAQGATSTAPQEPQSAADSLPVIPAVSAGLPAAAVPDVEELVRRLYRTAEGTDVNEIYGGIGDLLKEAAITLRALAAHYEARGMRKAAEICNSVSYAESERTLGRLTSGEYQIGAEFCASAILSAAAELERKP